MKIHLLNLNIFISRTTGLIWIKFSTKHTWMITTQVCSNEGPRPFPRGANNEIVKIHLHNLKIFFWRTTGLIWIKFSTKHTWVRTTQVCSKEGPRPFSRGDNNEIAKRHFLEQLSNFNQTWQNASLDKGDSIMFKWRATPRFQRGDNYEKAKIHWQNFEIFSRTTWPISTKLSTKHLWVKGI